MKEIWKYIDVFVFNPIKYSVSNLGNVRNNFTGKYITGDINNAGYYRVGLYHEGKHLRFFRHRLVGLYFVEGRTKEKKFINHKDGVKSHNYSSNLEWTTQSENEKHAFRNKLKKNVNKRPLIVVTFNLLIFRFTCQKEAAEYYGVKQTTVWNWLHTREAPSKYEILDIFFENEMPNDYFLEPKYMR